MNFTDCSLHLITIDCNILIDNIPQNTPLLYYLIVVLTEKSFKTSIISIINKLCHPILTCPMIFFAAYKRACVVITFSDKTYARLYKQWLKHTLYTVIWSGHRNAAQYRFRLLWLSCRHVIDTYRTVYIDFISI